MNCFQSVKAQLIGLATTARYVDGAFAREVESVVEQAIRVITNAEGENEAHAETVRLLEGVKRDMLIYKAFDNMAFLMDATESEYAAKYCDWRMDDDGVYQTACGNAFFFETGTATENKMRFCGYCGKSLVDTE